MSTQLPILLVVPLKPRGKDRHRASIVGGKNTPRHIHVWTPTATTNWEAAFRALAAHAMPQHGILLDLLEITNLAIFPTPARKLSEEPDWYGSKPDKDNVEKIILDALDPWLHDDAQVVAGPTVKIYAPENVEPAVICLIDRPPPCPEHPVVKLLLPYAPRT